MTVYFPTFRRWGSAIGRALASVPRWSPEALDRRSKRPITLGWKQWTALVGLLGGALAVVNIAIPGNPLRIWYWMNVVGARQQARYGFTVRLDVNRPYCMEMTHVEPGGAFDLAGVKAGWAMTSWSCLGFHVAEGFFASLRDAEGGTNLRLVFSPGGCADLCKKPSDCRHVTVVAPKGAA